MRFAKQIEPGITIKKLSRFPSEAVFFIFFSSRGIKIAGRNLKKYLEKKMKRFAFVTLLVVSALLLSSCSMHLGLSSMLNPGAETAKPAEKKIKATHTPPAPGSAAKATAGAGTSAAPAATTVSSAANTISLKDMAFTPGTEQVAVGTTVTWVNNDTVQHTVTSDTKLFDSGPMNPGDKFTYTFTQAGSFAFHCSIHTSMTGTITVQ